MNTLYSQQVNQLSFYRRVLDDRHVFVRQVDGPGFILRQIPVDADILQLRFAVLRRLPDLDIAAEEAVKVSSLILTTAPINIYYQFLASGGSVLFGQFAGRLFIFSLGRNVGTGT